MCVSDFKNCLHFVFNFVWGDQRLYWSPYFGPILSTDFKFFFPKVIDCFRFQWLSRCQQINYKQTNPESDFVPFQTSYNLSSEHYSQSSSRLEWCLLQFLNPLLTNKLLRSKLQKFDRCEQSNNFLWPWDILSANMDGRFLSLNLLNV